jgi:drug/metabolite transporter (DMT)-like permease
MATINPIPIAFGLLLGGIDAIMLSIVKQISMDRLKYLRFMVIPMFAFAIQPWFFLESLKYETLIVMNLMYDMISGILVTSAGYFIFGERLGIYKIMGILLSFLAILFLSLDENQ